MIIPLPGHPCASDSIVKMSDDEMALFMAAATASQYLINERQRKRKRQRRFWIHPVIADREERGQFWVMYQDLRDHEDKFLDYTRMSIKRLVKNDLESFIFYIVPFGLPPFLQVKHVHFCGAQLFFLIL